MNTLRQQRDAVMREYNGLPKLTRYIDPIFRWEFVSNKITVTGSFGNIRNLPVSCTSRLFRAIHVATGVDKVTLVSPARYQRIARPRFIFMHVANVTLRKNLSDIGRMLRRDHTTIMHGIARAHDLRISDSVFRRQYESVMAVL